MALKQDPKPRIRTVGHISRDAQLRIDRRVKKILDREGALDRARRAARRLKGG